MVKYKAWSPVSRLQYKRILSIFIFIGILALMLIFTACPSDTPMDPYNSYYGKWEGYRTDFPSLTYTMELSRNRIKITSITDNWYQMNIINWTPQENPLLNSYQYPTYEPGITNGYIITGLSHPDITINWSDIFFVGLSRDRTKMILNLSPNSSSGVEHIYTRQRKF